MVQLTGDFQNKTNIQSWGLASSPVACCAMLGLLCTPVVPSNKHPRPLDSIIQSRRG